MTKALLSEADLRAALRLANEARELPRGSVAQLNHVIHGLAALVDAQVGIYAEVEPCGRTVHLLDFGWATESERAYFLEYAKGGPSDTFSDPMVEAFMGRVVGPPVAAMRHELVSDRDWYRSPHVQELRRPARVDSCIYAGWRSQGVLRGLALHRGWGEPAFADRERALVSAVSSECTSLREPPLLAGLPPRMREVLDLLSRGSSEKQIAAELGLSIHTVHDHVKALHRRLRVQSRGELLAVALRS